MMDPVLASDQRELSAILQEACGQAVAFLHTLAERPAAQHSTGPAGIPLPERGEGAASALHRFKKHYEAGLSGSAGPRYFGFVTGGSTPAALAGDWLASTYDQNLSNAVGSAAAAVEAETLQLLRDLFKLPATFEGCFVTGATMANFVGLACARQWVAERLGQDAAEAGLSGLPPFRILTATPHASAIKALAMLGIGRRSIERIATLPGREAIDVVALEQQLRRQTDTPPIVLASAGTVNSGDFDNLAMVARLCRRHGAWLHVDGAFGLFAACWPETEQLLAGIAEADSIAADAHKWLNVPYDCGIVFTRHLELQERVFRASAPYLAGAPQAAPDFLNRTPENSRRFRALPAWMTLVAYGRQGYRDLVERNCRFARSLGAWIERSDAFQLLAPVRLNVVCFRLADRILQGQEPQAVTRRFLQHLEQEGRIFLTPTVYDGQHGMRAAISNWSTTEELSAVVIEALQHSAATLTFEG